MKAILLAAVALFGTAIPSGADVSGLRYERSLTVSAAVGQACAVLDAGVFAHANSQTLDDLHIYRKNEAGQLLDVPFRLSISDTQTTEDDVAPVMNFHGEKGAMDFDLRMPPRPHSSVTLDLAAKDFMGTAIVSGRMTPDGPPTALGTFAVFDMSARHLSRSTTLPLEESNYALLHVQLHLRASDGEAMPISAAMVRAAVVPPSRQAQRVYSVVASSGFHREGTDSVAVLHLPEHVPAERMRFVVAPEFKGNFEREVDVVATQDGATATESAHGTISRVEMPPGSGEPMPIHSENLAVDTAFAANFQAGATVRVVVHDAGEASSLLQAVNVEMRQRQMCFDALPNAQYVALYGGGGDAVDRKTAPALLDKAKPLVAVMGPEIPNPAYKPHSASKGVLEREPDLLLVSTVGVLAILGSVALRRRRTRRS